MKLILSPCIICASNGIYSLSNLFDVLTFITNYLNVEFDTYNGSYYNENSWYSPPAYMQTTYLYFTTQILPLLQSLLITGETIALNEENIEYESIDSEFKITDEEQFHLLIKYVSTLNANEPIVMFVGEDNYEYNVNYVQFRLKQHDALLNIPIVKDPYIDESGNFNQSIRENISTNKIFMNDVLCKKFPEIVKKVTLGMGSGDKPNIYKKYGEIVAKRNNFIDFKVKNPYKNTNYYIRKDNKYIISVDLTHGTFEVFINGKKKPDFINEYDLSGTPLKTKNSNPETHKVYR